MASKAERTRVAGTTNVYCIDKIRAIRVIDAYREAYCDEFPWTEVQRDPTRGPNYLGHHARMITATNKIKARRDFIDDLLK